MSGHGGNAAQGNIFIISFRLRGRDGDPSTEESQCWGSGRLSQIQTTVLTPLPLPHLLFPGIPQHILRPAYSQRTLGRAPVLSLVSTSGLSSFLFADWGSPTGPIWQTWQSLKSMLTWPEALPPRPAASWARIPPLAYKEPSLCLAVPGTWNPALRSPMQPSSQAALSSLVSCSLNPELLCGERGDFLWVKQIRWPGPFGQASRMAMGGYDFQCTIYWALVMYQAT